MTKTVNKKADVKQIDELQDQEKLKRKHVVKIKLNDLELEALQTYIKKYRVTNKSQFIRETLFLAVLKKFEEDYPTLFDLSCL